MTALDVFIQDVESGLTPGLRLLAWQDSCASTAVYPGRGSGSITALMYLGLGVTGEAGEIADEIKKCAREQRLEDQHRDKIKMEVGDVMWYLANLCNELNLTLEECMLVAAHKLRARRDEGRLHAGGRSEA